MISGLAAAAGRRSTRGDCRYDRMTGFGETCSESRRGVNDRSRNLVALPRRRRSTSNLSDLDVASTGPGDKKDQIASGLKLRWPGMRASQATEAFAVLWLAMGWQDHLQAIFRHHRCSEQSRADARQDVFRRASGFDQQGFARPGCGQISLEPRLLLWKLQRAPCLCEHGED